MPNRGKPLSGATFRWEELCAEQRAHLCPWKQVAPKTCGEATWTKSWLRCFCLGTRHRAMRRGALGSQWESSSVLSLLPGRKQLCVPGPDEKGKARPHPPEGQAQLLGMEPLPPFTWKALPGTLSPLPSLPLQPLLSILGASWNTAVLRGKKITKKQDKTTWYSLQGPVWNYTASDYDTEFPS